MAFALPEYKRIKDKKDEKLSKYLDLAEHVIKHEDDGDRSVVKKDCGNWRSEEELEKRIEKKLNGSCTRMLKQILKAASYKAGAIRPPTTHLEDRPN